MKAINTDVDNQDFQRFGQLNYLKILSLAFLRQEIECLMSEGRRNSKKKEGNESMLMLMVKVFNDLVS